MRILGEVMCTLQVTLASSCRWLLPPQALNAYYLPNKNQMGKELFPDLPEWAQEWVCLPLTMPFF